MDFEQPAPRTRRAVLAAGVGGALAVVAATLGRPTAVAAANGDPVAAGGSTSATLTTTVRNTADGTGLLAVSGNDAVSGAAKIGVYGYANQDANARAIYGKSLLGTGVWGNSDSGRGLFGRSTSGTAVSAQTDTGRGVYATTGGSDKTAILGQATADAVGVQGFSGNGVPPGLIVQTGVQGNADQDAGSIGVYGASTPGTGVVGESDEGSGVFGAGFSGVYGLGSYGVIGDTGDGTGVYGWTGADSPPAGPTQTAVYAAAETGRTALSVDGVAKFSRSGSTTLSSGSSKTVTGVALTASSLVFAVLQTNRSGVWVRAIVPNVAGSSFVVYLNTSVSASTKLAWFVVN